MSEPMTDERLDEIARLVREPIHPIHTIDLPAKDLYDLYHEIRRLREENERIAAMKLEHACDEMEKEIRRLRGENERLTNDHKFFHDDVVAAMELLNISVHARPESDHVVFRKEVLPKLAKLQKENERFRRTAAYSRELLRQLGELRSFLDGEK